MDYHDKLIKNWHKSLPVKSLLLTNPKYADAAIYWVTAHFRVNLTRTQFRVLYNQIQKSNPKGALIMQLQWLEKYLKRSFPNIGSTHPGFKAIHALMERLTFEPECYTIERITQKSECIEQDPYKVLRARYNHRDID